MRPIEGHQRDAILDGEQHGVGHQLVSCGKCIAAKLENVADCVYSLDGILLSNATNL
jgi:hypothetical protein